jgi:two-component sensor histidine kinase
MEIRSIFKQFWFLGTLFVALGIVLYTLFFGSWQYAVALFASYSLIFYAFYLAEKRQFAYAKQLEKSVEKNHFLLREMHHRIKNNMQVMMGFLETQSFKVHDPKYKQMFQSHVDRIKAMSYLHQNLYDEKSRERIDMREYLGSIIRNLQLMTSNTIQLQSEACSLSMRQALNVGLIVNEAVSNAIKYAYDDFNGTINVVLKREEDQCMLMVQDFGKGYDPAALGDETLGVDMIEDMAAYLDESTVTVNTQFGVTIVVRFSEGE